MCSSLMFQQSTLTRGCCDELNPYSSTAQASALECNISTKISTKSQRELIFYKLWKLVSLTSWCKKRKFDLTSTFNKGEDLTCFIVVGGELFQHLPIHAEDALLQNAGVRQATLSFFQGLQLLLQGLWQVGLHIICCSLEDSQRRTVKAVKGRAGGHNRISNSSKSLESIFETSPDCSTRSNLQNYKPLFGCQNVHYVNAVHSNLY